MNDTLRPLANGDFEVLKEGSPELEMYLKQEKNKCCACSGHSSLVVANVGRRDALPGLNREIDIEITW